MEALLTSFFFYEIFKLFYGLLVFCAFLIFWLLVLSTSDFCCLWTSTAFGVVSFCRKVVFYDFSEGVSTALTSLVRSIISIYFMQV